MIWLTLIIKDISADLMHNCNNQVYVYVIWSITRTVRWLCLMGCIRDAIQTLTINVTRLDPGEAGRAVPWTLISKIITPLLHTQSHTKLSAWVIFTCCCQSRLFWWWLFGCWSISWLSVCEHFRTSAHAQWAKNSLFYLLICV